MSSTTGIFDENVRKLCTKELEMLMNSGDKSDLRRIIHEITIHHQSNIEQLSDLSSGTLF